MKVNLIVFDFDGTLFNTKKDIAASINTTLKKYGVQPVDENKIWSYTGDGTEVLLKRILGEEKSFSFKNILDDTLNYYSINFANFTEPVDNVIDFLDKFKEKKKVILSNKNRDIITKILNKFNLCEKFQAVYGKDSFTKNKPDPYPLLKIMEEFEMLQRNTIFIGDSANDIIISKKAKVRAFIIPSGATPIEEIEKLKPFKIFYDYREIENLIE